MGDNLAAGAVEKSCEGPRQFAPQGACCVPSAGLRSGEEHGHNEVGFLGGSLGHKAAEGVDVSRLLVALSCANNRNAIPMQAERDGFVQRAALVA